MASGINLKTGADRLGRSDVNAILKTYTHPTADMHSAASEEIKRRLNGGK